MFVAAPKDEVDREWVICPMYQTMPHLASPDRVLRRQVQVEDFKDAELMLDITEHTLVPEHKVGGRTRVRFCRCPVCSPSTEESC